MAMILEKFAGLAATVLADCDRNIEAQASSIRPNGERGADESKSMIELTLTEGDEETVARISVSRTRDRPGVPGNQRAV